MKKIILALVLMSAVLTGCKKESPFWSPIKERIIDDAMGVEYKTELVELTPIDTFYVSESIDDWYLLVNDDGGTREECREWIEDFVNEMDSYYQTCNEEPDIDYYVWKQKFKRIKELEAKQPADVDFYVVYVHYKFENPVLNNAMVNVKRYYLLSSDMQVTNKIDKDDFDELAKDYVKTKSLKYDVWKYQDAND